MLSTTVLVIAVIAVFLTRLSSSLYTFIHFFLPAVKIAPIIRVNLKGKNKQKDRDAKNDEKKKCKKIDERNSTRHSRPVPKLH